MAGSDRRPQPAGSGKERKAPFSRETDALPVGMPAWAPRALAWLLSLLLVAALTASALVPFSRTVRGSFVLLPAGPTEPILAPADGYLEEILMEEGQAVSAGQVLFLVRSPVDAAEGTWGTSFVTSPVDGVIMHGDRLEAGEPLEAGRPLARVAPAGVPVHAVIELPEDALPSLEPGQAVRLLFAAYPSQEFGARGAVLRRLNPVPVRSGDGYVVRAFADLSSSYVTVRGEGQPLLAGLRGEARVVVERKPLIGNLFARAGKR